MSRRRPEGGVSIPTRRRRNDAKGQTDDGEVLGIAGGAGINLVGAAVRQIALAGVLLILSRWLGPAGVGVYALAFAFLSLISLVSAGGLEAGLTRFVAAHLAEGDRRAMHGTVRLGIGLTTALAVALGAGLYLAAPSLAKSVFSDPQLVTPLRYIAFTLPAITLMEASLAATKGFRTMKPFALIRGVIEPLVRLGLTLALISIGMGLQGAMLALLVSNVVAAVPAGWVLLRLMGVPTFPPTYRPFELLKFSAVSWMGALSLTGLVWVDTLLLGIYGSSTDVGLYNVATRMVALATMVMTSVYVSFGPRIADLHQRGHTDTLERSYRLATSWILRLSLPFFVVLLAFPEELLSLFGSNFTVSAAVMVIIILVVGRLADAASGPGGAMLTMSGRPGLATIDNLAVLGLNVGLNIWLIPRYGIVGAAVAWGVSLCLVNVARSVQVWLTMHMQPFSPDFAKGLVAGAGSLVAGLLVQYWVDGSASLPAGAAVIVALYVGLVAFLGITDEDRSVLRALASRTFPCKSHNFQSGTA